MIDRDAIRARGAQGAAVSRKRVRVWALARSWGTRDIILTGGPKVYRTRGQAEKEAKGWEREGLRVRVVKLVEQP